VNTTRTREQILAELLEREWLPSATSNHDWHCFTKRGVRVWVLDRQRPNSMAVVHEQTELTRLVNPIHAHPSVDVSQIMGEVEELFDGYTL
jgi:metallophosphoesterase superfamily enzyme